MSEQAWLLDMLAASPAGLLLDLHNLYTNGINFGFDPESVLRSLPLERVQAIHIAGGVDVPDPLARGRNARSDAASPSAWSIGDGPDGRCDSRRLSAPIPDEARRAAAQLESFLARVYTDDQLRDCLVAGPVEQALSEGLPPDLAHRFADLDRFGLRLAAASFARKRAAASHTRPSPDRRLI